MLADWFGVPNAEALALVSLYERAGNADDVARRTGMASETVRIAVARLRAAGLDIPKCSKWQTVYRLTPTARAQVLEAYEFTARLLSDHYVRWADARIEALETALGLASEVPAEYRLTPRESALWRLLAPGKLVSKERIHLAIYGDGDNVAEPKIIDVFLTKLRRKLAPHGVVIRTVWGQGLVLESGGK